MATPPSTKRPRMQEIHGKNKRTYLPWDKKKRFYHWAITGHTKWVGSVEFHAHCLGLPHAAEALTSESHTSCTGQLGKEDHYHTYLRLDHQYGMTANALKKQLGVLGANIWLNPIMPPDEATPLRVSVENYIEYCKKKGPLFLEGAITGDSPPSTSDAVEEVVTAQTVPLDKSLQSRIAGAILTAYTSGERKSVILRRWPSWSATVDRLAQYHTPRIGHTKVWYVYGPTGTRKSTTVQRALNSWKTLHPEEDFFVKSGGLTKWWAGYDNQPICLFDDTDNVESKDPNTMDCSTLKQIMSTGQCQVEVKHSHMTFNSHLIIWVSNYTPEEFSRKWGGGKGEGVAMLRRFTNDYGAVEVDTPERARGLMAMMLYILNIHFDRTVQYADFQKHIGAPPTPIDQTKYNLDLCLSVMDAWDAVHPDKGLQCGETVQWSSDEEEVEEVPQAQ